MNGQTGTIVGTYICCLALALLSAQTKVRFVPQRRRTRSDDLAEGLAGWANGYGD